MRHNYLFKKKQQIEHSTRKPGIQMHYSITKEQRRQHKRSTSASFINKIHLLLFIAYPTNVVAKVTAKMETEQHRPWRR